MTPRRLAGSALLVGGLALSLSYWLQDAAGREATTGPLVGTAIVADIFGALLVPLGLTGWLVAHARNGRVPAGALIAFTMTALGFPILEVGSSIFTAAAPGIEGVEEFETVTALTAGLFAFGLIGTNLGMVVLGVVGWRARVFPRPASLMVAAGPLLVFALPFSFPFAEALVLSVGFLGLAWVGWSMVRENASGFAAQDAPALVQ